MSEYEMPSIKKNIEELEGENLWVKLSSLEEELRTLDAQGRLNAWQPDERVRQAELMKEIAEIKTKLPYKKAA